MSIKQLIDDTNFQEIEQALTLNAGLANEDIPYDEKDPSKAHPLHRICDGVFSGKYSDDDAVKMAKIFLAHGAHINGNELVEKKDTPLIAASSLHADKVAILYIDNGSNLKHQGCHGGTALHWAAWCGREKVVKKLIEAGAEIDKLSIDFIATPLFWAVHGIKTGGSTDKEGSLACVKALIEAGADKTVPNVDGNTVFDLLAENDEEFMKLLQEN